MRNLITKKLNCTCITLLGTVEPPLYFVAADSPYIYSYLNLFTTVTATNTFSQLPK